MVCPRFRIAIIEDHIDFRQALAEALLAEGYEVSLFDSAEAFVEQRAAAPCFELMLVDLNLPGEDGISLVKRIKQVQPNIGVIMITARDLEEQRKQGYDSGADIYMTKPVSLEELKAAIRALAKRLRRPDNEASLTLDVARGCLVGLEGRTVNLSSAEVAILSALVSARNQRLEAWQLIEAIGKSAETYSKAALEIVIVRLRKRLREVGASASGVRAIRGWGYQLYLPLQIL